MTSFKGRGRSAGFEKRSVGKRVARAAAAGGSRSYKGDRPINWYASLVVIVILGIASIVYSRYERLHAATAASHTHKAQSASSWYVALSADVCGVVEPPLATSPSPKPNQIIAEGNGLLDIPPGARSKKGEQVTLGDFLSSYPSLAVSSTSLRYPGKGTWRNGERCPTATSSSKGSHSTFAGKKGVVEVASWSSVASSHPVMTYRNPSHLTLHNGEMITLAFLPKGVSVPKPPASYIADLLKAISSAAPTGASSTPNSTSTVPNSTTSTVPVHASTVPVHASTVPAHTSTVPAHTSTVPAHTSP